MRFLRFSRQGGFPLIPLVILLLAFSVELESAPAKKPCRWRYIVIHHSATRKGNAAIMDRYHSNHRHMRNGLAYHFVIGNGTSGCGDGEIEVGHRWKEQLPGGHAKQQWLNKSGIGICLVGNFNRQGVSKKQMASLVKLVNRLRATYGIPLSRIKGHGDFKGEKTVCPGRNFSMHRFKKLLTKKEGAPRRRTRRSPS
jgi:N-acetylmuramoyl-L-alanine amidase CwlA